MAFRYEKFTSTCLYATKRLLFWYHLNEDFPELNNEVVFNINSAVVEITGLSSAWSNEHKAIFAIIGMSDGIVLEYNVMKQEKIREVQIFDDIPVSYIELVDSNPLVSNLGIVDCQLYVYGSYSSKTIAFRELYKEDLIIKHDTELPYCFCSAALLYPTRNPPLLVVQIFSGIIVFDLFKWHKQEDKYRGEVLLNNDRVSFLKLSTLGQAETKDPKIMIQTCERTLNVLEY